MSRSSAAEKKEPRGKTDRQLEIERLLARSWADNLSVGTVANLRAQLALLEKERYR